MNIEAAQTAIEAGWALDTRINKWRHPDSSACYCDTPRWGLYACEDHNIPVGDRARMIRQAGMEAVAKALELR